MNDSIEKRIDEFQVKLKKSNEILYFEFLNLRHDLFTKVIEHSEQRDKELERFGKEIEKSSLRGIKSENTIHDLDVQIKAERGELKKNINKDIVKLRDKFESGEYIDKLFDKLIDHANTIGLAVMGRPRFCGFILLISGHSGIEKLVKFIEQNRSGIKKNNPTEYSNGEGK